MRYDITPEEKEVIAKQFGYRTPSPSQLARQRAIRELVHDATIKIKSMTPKSREQSIALTHLETAMFYANAAIARHEGQEEE